MWRHGHDPLEPLLQVKIGDSAVMIGGAGGPDCDPPAPAHLYMLVDDVDAAYKQALAVGATGVPGQVRAGMAAHRLLLYGMNTTTQACHCPSDVSILAIWSVFSTSAPPECRSQLTSRMETAWPA